MDSSTSPTTITFSTLQSKSLIYPDFASASLTDLDTFRYVTVPTSLLSQRQNPQETPPAKPPKANKSGTKSATSGSQSAKLPYLEKSDLKTLIEWKLKHGTFRPRLLALVSSNSEQDVERITAEAFEMYSKTLGGVEANLNDEQDTDEDVDAIIKAVTHLTKLTGVGPASASLILACFDPINVPFFSDEFFRWLLLDDDSSKGPGGWERKIGYSMKEYRLLVERLRDLRRRLGKSLEAVEAEKAAWVLGHETRERTVEIKGKAGVVESGDGKDGTTKRKFNEGKQSVGNGRGRKKKRAVESEE